MTVVNATCPACKCPAADVDGCPYSVIAFREPNGETVERAAIPYDHPGHVCHDCGARHGSPHHVECDAAQCPRCGGQLLCCGCDIAEFRQAA